MFARLARLLIIVLLVLTSGCASMYNPLTPGPLEDEHPILKACAFPADYQSGVKCAKQVHGKYLEAATADATLSDRFFIAMVPISLAAVGVGIAGGSGNAITGLALASATGLGWGTWLTSKTRRELYALGAQAIGCLITASSPLDISSERLGAMKDHRTGLSTALSSLTMAVEELENETLKVNMDIAAKLKEDGDLEEAKKLEGQAKEFLRTADATIDTLGKGGRTVWNATMDVHAQVVTAQVKNSNDLRDFSEHLQGMVYGTFQDVIGLAGIPSPFGKKSRAGALPPQPQKIVSLTTEQTELISILKQAQNQVRVAMATLQYDSQSIDLADLNSQFATCLNPLNQFQPVKALRVSPSSLVQLKTSAPKKIRITGGTPPYTITPEWSSNIDLKAEGPPDSGPAIVTITAGNKVPADTYRLSVEDSAQTAVIVRIVVTASADENNSTEKSNKPGQEEDKKVPAAKKSIRDALNSSNDVKRSAWENVGEQEWEASDTASNGDLRFVLQFKTKAAASNAKGETAKVHKLQALNNEQDVFAVNSHDQDLEIIIPKAKIEALVKAIEQNKWP